MNTIKRLLKSKLAKNGIWLVLLQGFNMIVPLLTLPHITRVLSAAAYGEFSVALNWISYFQVFVEYGFGLAGARKVATRHSDDELNGYCSNILFARLLLASVCMLFFVLVVVVAAAGKTQIICMCILFLIVLSTALQQTWFFQGLSEMKDIVLISVGSRLVSVILIFTCVKAAEDLYLYCVLYASTFLITSIVGSIVVLKKYKVKIRFPGVKTMVMEIAEGWPLFVSSAMTKIFGNLGITILGFIASVEIVGIYSAINKIPYVLTILFSAISQAFYPQMCSSFSQSFESGVKAVKKYGGPVIGIFAVGCVMMICFHHFIVQIAFGAEYASRSWILVFLVAWVFFGIINNFLGIQTLVASGHQREYSRCFSISTVCMIVLMFLMGMIWKEYGIALASFCSEVVLTCLLWNKIKNIRSMLSET